jgi:hypothetical protein
MYRVKRLGKDLDDLFWTYGKIHGLENLAFVDADKLKATNGNPVKIQKLVNEVEGSNVLYSSPEKASADLAVDLSSYKGAVNKLNLNTSDRKKLLALPFYLSKR